MENLSPKEQHLYNIAVVKAGSTDREAVIKALKEIALRLPKGYEDRAHRIIKAL